MERNESRMNTASSSRKADQPKASNDRRLVAMEEISWKTLILGSHFPEEFDAGNWSTLPGEEYPIDIVLGLRKLTNVYKVLIDVDEHHIPSRVDISVGLGSVDAPVDYRSAREADFDRVVAMEYHKRERSQSRMESKAAFTDTIGQYVWMQVHRPLEHRKNTGGEVTIKKVTVLGYPLTKSEIAAMRAPKKQPTEKRPLAKESTEVIPHPPPVESKNPSTTPNEPVVSNGDGMKTSSDVLGGDPLTCIRTVKRTLKHKIEDSNKAGREVEATVCLRAVQRLNEYEAMLEDLSSRRSNALIHNELELAERHRLAMIDCRDTALRVVHVDLLFNKAELRSIGVASEWNENP